MFIDVCLWYTMSTFSSGNWHWCTSRHTWFDCPYPTPSPFLFLDPFPVSPVSVSQFLNVFFILILLYFWSPYYTKYVMVNKISISGVFYLCQISSHTSLSCLVGHFALCCPPVAICFSAWERLMLDLNSVLWQVFFLKGQIMGYYVIMTDTTLTLMQISP